MEVESCEQPTRLKRKIASKTEVSDIITSSEKSLDPRALPIVKNQNKAV